MEPGRIVRVQPAAPSTDDPNDPPPTRQWLVTADKGLRPLLPRHPQEPLLTEQLCDKRGRPVDLVAHFGVRTWGLESIWVNFLGLSDSAQMSQMTDRVGPSAPWPQFDEVWIPVGGDLESAGRLGMARDVAGAVVDSECIVILPGLHGGQDVQRTRDLAAGLRQSGLHVLALDPRGQGLTEERYPTRKYTWGVFETDDLLRVSDWLMRQGHIRRTGLIGFSWSANQALLVAWRDGQLAGNASIALRLAKHLAAPPPGRRYEAGVIAFSPVLRFEELMDKLELRRGWPFSIRCRRACRTRSASG